MEVKIDSNNNIDYKNNSIKTVKDVGTSFLDILNQKTNNTTSTETATKEDILSKIKTITGNTLIDNLPDKNKGDVLYAINKLKYIFGIDILGNPSQFCNKDSTINITRILDLYGNKVTASDLNDLSTSINTLRDNGLINDEDYFSALKWIATKQEAFKVKMQHEKNEDSISNLILKHKKHPDEDKN